MSKFSQWAMLRLDEKGKQRAEPSLDDGAKNHGITVTKL